MICGTFWVCFILILAYFNQFLNYVTCTLFNHIDWIEFHSQGIFSSSANSKQEISDIPNGHKKPIILFFADNHQFYGFKLIQRDWKNITYFSYLVELFDIELQVPNETCTCGLMNFNEKIIIA